MDYCGLFFIWPFRKILILCIVVTAELIFSVRWCRIGFSTITPFGTEGVNFFLLGSGISLRTAFYRLILTKIFGMNLAIWFNSWILPDGFIPFLQYFFFHLTIPFTKFVAPVLNFIKKFIISRIKLLQSTRPLHTSSFLIFHIIPFNFLLSASPNSFVHIIIYFSRSNPRQAQYNEYYRKYDCQWSSVFLGWFSGFTDFKSWIIRLLFSWNHVNR